MTKRELIEALEALACHDEAQIIGIDFSTDTPYSITELCVSKLNGVAKQSFRLEEIT